MTTLAQLTDGGCFFEGPRWHDGRWWVSDFYRHGVFTVTPEGQGVFACMLGGDDGRTLLLCCAPDSAASRRKAAREAVLMTARVDVPHAGRP